MIFDYDAYWKDQDDARGIVMIGNGLGCPIETIRLPNGDQIPADGRTWGEVNGNSIDDYPTY